MKDNGGHGAVESFAIAADGERWICSGPLTFANAAQAFIAAAALPLPTTGEMAFDGLTAVDSAAVAVLLCLKRRGMEEGATLRFTGMPDTLHALATVYDVDRMLSDDARG